jgi:integrase
MKDVLKRAGISWHGWHGFRRGLASNLNRLGVDDDDSVIQRILRHSTVATTQNHYIKTASPDAIAAIKQFSEALLCSTYAPDGDVEAKGSVQ